ncbi:MAG TPA: hypothetical protein VF295_00415 [Candidatus Limnocylindria bacterium]
MTERGSSSGGLTGATGDLTPDEIQRDFEPGEWREASDPVHHADVTRSQAATAPAQQGEIGVPGGGPEVGGSDGGADDPPQREPQIGGDERTDHEEHL